MCVARPSRHSGFTLVELLVVIGIIAVLMGILLPTLATAQRASRQVKCLSNIRSMQIAQWNYVVENKGYLIQAGLPHGGTDDRAEAAWINTLQRYYSTQLVHRCPSDDSIHWPGGVVVPNSGTPGRFRLTSYGINSFLDPDLAPLGYEFKKINQIRKSSATIQFLEMTYTGEFAGSDHPHIGAWGNSSPHVIATLHLQTNAHGKPGQTAKRHSKANYGFIDGHAETLRFDEVFSSYTKNKFDPRIAQ